MDGIRAWKIDHGLIRRISFFGQKEIGRHPFVSVGGVKSDLLPDPLLFHFRRFHNGIELGFVIGVLVQEKGECLIGDRLLA